MRDAGEGEKDRRILPNITKCMNEVYVVRTSPPLDNRITYLQNIIKLCPTYTRIVVTAEIVRCSTWHESRKVICTGQTFYVSVCNPP